MKIPKFLAHVFAIVIGISASACTAALPEYAKADNIIVNKRSRELILLWEGNVLKRYLKIGTAPIFRGHFINDY